MLTPEEIKYIEHTAYTSDQEWHYWCIFAGEPFLIENALCYFDGEILTINGYTLDRSEFNLSRIQSVVNAKECFASTSYLWYWGPREIEHHSEMEGFDSKDFSEPSHLFAGHVLPLKEFSLERLPKARRDVKKAKNRGITVQENPSRIIGLEHIRLLEQFFATHELSSSEWGLTWAIQAHFAMQHMVLLEARRDGKLCGLGLVSELIPTRHNFLLGFFDQSVSGATDMLYYSVIERAIERGADYLHLGHCVGSEGLHHLKSKWGTVQEADPPYYYAFYRRGIEMPSDKEAFLSKFHFGWSARLTQKFFNSLPGEHTKQTFEERMAGRIRRVS